MALLAAMDHQRRVWPNDQMAKSLGCKTNMRISVFTFLMAKRAKIPGDPTRPRPQSACRPPTTFKANVAALMATQPSHALS